MSILEKLFDGNLGLCEDFNPNRHPAYYEIGKKIQEYTEYFIEKLSDEDWNKMDDMTTANFALGELGNSHHFKQGFKLATMIWHEAFLHNL